MKDKIRLFLRKLNTRFRLKTSREEIAETIQNGFRSPRFAILLHFSIITFIGLTIFRNLLFSDGWPAGGDALGIVSRVYIFGKDLRWLYVWRPHSFGFVEVVHAYDFFLMLLYWIFANAIVTTKVFLFLTFIVSGFSSYSLAYWYTKNPTASFAASLIYTLNQWLFSQYTEAHGDILFSFSLVPLVFLALFKVCEQPTLKRILIAGLALGLFVSAFHPECVVIYGVSFPIFAITYLLMPEKSSTLFKRFKNLVKASLPLGVLCFVLASFVFVPMLFKVQPRYYSASYKYFLEESYGGVYKNLTSAFALGAVEVWGYINLVDVTSGLSILDFPSELLSIVIFSLAFCMVFIKKDRYTVFFVISATFSIFVAKGPNPPFGYLYLWAWWNVPYFAVFRAANRWIMMAVLADSFLTAALVDILIKHVKGKNYVSINYAFAKLGSKTLGSLEKLKLETSVKITQDFFVRFYKVLHYLSILILVAIFLNGFCACWYFFQDGLQVYSLPRSYTEPYEWLGTQSGDYKIISVNCGPGRWRNEPAVGFDFGYGGMLTRVGWAHDVGFESSFIHDKPVMQDGGWDSNAKDFVEYLRFRLAGQQKTRDFLEMTGLFNYKYIVLPPYLESDIRDFFLNQSKAADNIIYDKDGAIIIENPYYTPKFFAASNHVNLLGGLVSFPSIYKIGSVGLNGTAFFFINKLDSESFAKLQEDADSLMFVNSDLLDLVMLQLRDRATVINAADFAVNSLDVSKYWVPVSSWKNVGALVYGDKTLATCSNSSIDIPFEAANDGIHEILVRIGYLSYRGNMTVEIDSQYVAKIKPEADYWCGLLWVKLGSLDLTRGKHTITLINDGFGYNDVDAIAIIQSGVLQDTHDEVLRSLETFPGRMINVLGAASRFGFELPEGWSIYSQQYEDDLLGVENPRKSIPTPMNVSASSIQYDHLPQDAVDGSYDTRWASDPEEATPQWLQMEWPAATEMVGLSIDFEKACAKDYTIQAWNGTEWVTQVEVVGNKLLSPVHMFAKPVTTDKLLIHVTSYGSSFNMVSIFEVKPFTLSSVAANYYIAKQGRYMVALRLEAGSEHAPVDLKIGNTSFSVDCQSAEDGFRWFEVGPLQLERGNCSIALTPHGKLMFDQMILYSLRENENETVLQNLFRRPLSPPTYIQSEMLNPTSYILHVKTENPFNLVFSESYHPLWKAKLADGQEIEPINTYSIVNSFYINRTGEFDIKIYFEGQTYVDLGLRLSLSCLIIISIILLMPKRVFDYLRKIRLRRHASGG